MRSMRSLASISSAWVGALPFNDLLTSAHAPGSDAPGPATTPLPIRLRRPRRVWSRLGLGAPLRRACPGPGIVLRRNQPDFSGEPERMMTMVRRSLGKSFTHWWGLPLRAIVGYGFVAHGYAKLARGPEHFTGILAALHMPFPEILAWATILTEIIGGLAFILGAFLPLVGVPMIVVLLVAIVTVHLPNGFSSIKLQAITPQGAHFGQPGYETDLLYLAAIVALMVGGSGPLSVGSPILKPRRVTR